jgi:hypothetical protein
MSSVGPAAAIDTAIGATFDATFERAAAEFGGR